MATATGKNKTIIYLPDDLYERLWDERIKTRVPVTTQVVQAIRSHFDRKPRKPRPERTAI